MGYRWVIGGAALATVLLRLPGLAWPPRADESGFLLVARHWAPGPEGSTSPTGWTAPPSWSGSSGSATCSAD